MQVILAEFTHAVRRLRRVPAFTLTAVVTLAVAIATNTLAFTLLEAVVWRPLPAAEPQSLVRIFPVDAEGRQGNLFPLARYREFSRQTPGLVAVAGYLPFEVTSSDGADTRAALAYAVSASYFPMIGMEPRLGRSFSREEETDPGARVVVIGHRLWTREFRADPEVLGRTLALNGRPFIVIGVGPEAFRGTEPLDADYWVPLSAHATLDPSFAGGDPRHEQVLVVGRLAPGSHRDDVSAALSALLADPGQSPRSVLRARAVPATFFHAGPEFRSVITLALGTVALVLLIACANVANLVLARAVDRRRELAVRRALGASTSRLLGNLMAENVIVALAAGGLGLAMSTIALEVLYPVATSLLPFNWVTLVLDVSPDARVFLYTLLLSILASIVIGLSPVRECVTQPIANAFQGANAIRQSTGVRAAWLRQSLVIVQVAVCVMLLSVAVMATRALQRTEALDIGLDPSGVVHTQVDLERHGYNAPIARSFYDRMIARALGMPGVREVGVTTHVPLTGGVKRVQAYPEGSTQGMPVTYTAASANYFRILGIPIVSGRTFSPDEAASDAPVAVVSEALVRRMWGTSSPLGRRLAVESRNVPLTVVGVARDASTAAIWLEKEISIYVPANTGTSANLRVLVKTTQSPSALAADLVREARIADPRVRFDAVPMTDVVEMWVLPSRVAAVAAALLGSVAFTLAILGVYGLMVYVVRQRRAEIAIRTALGARPRDIAGLMVTDAGRTIAIGVVIGVLGALSFGSLVASVLPGAVPRDWMAMVLASGTLASTGLLACYVPARSASRADPLPLLKAM